MGFMKPVIREGEFWEVEVDLHEVEYLPGDLVTYSQGEVMDCADFADYVIGKPTGAILRDGFLWRLSAPGYTDSTDWSAADSLDDAIRDCLGMYGDGFDREDLEEIGSYLDGFSDFTEGYFLALGFTSTIDDESGSGDPTFPAPGKEFRDVYSVDEITQYLTDDEYVSCLSDCLEFWLSAHDMIPDDRAESAGSDFHFTRNGHGAGFWDGDWPEHGDKLTDLAKTYGTCELSSWRNESGQLEFQIHN